MFNIIKTELKFQNKYMINVCSNQIDFIEAN